MIDLDLNEVINSYISDDFSPKKAESIAKVYIDLVEQEGFSPNEETKEFAIIAEREFESQTARPKEFAQNNKTSHRQGKGIATETIKDYKKNELHINSPDFVDKAKEKFDSIKDTPEETSFCHVEDQIRNSLEKELRNPKVEQKIIDAIREHMNYNYNDIEVKTFANQIITHVSENQAEYISNRLSHEMNSDDVYKEQRTIKNTMSDIFLNKSNFWKGLGNGIGQKIYKYLSKEGIKIIGLIIGGTISGAASLGLI